jgi:hypothetical protein
MQLQPTIIMEGYTNVPRYGKLEIEQEVTIAQYLCVSEEARTEMLSKVLLPAQNSCKAMGPGV